MTIHLEQPVDRLYLSLTVCQQFAKAFSASRSSTRVRD
jgi:hypothetical protein